MQQEKNAKRKRVKMQQEIVQYIKRVQHEKINTQKSATW